MLNKAIFLDRDGVVNKDNGYVYRVDDFEFEKNAIRGLKLIDFNRYLLIIISNQAGIAKGYYNENDFKQLQEWLFNFLLKRGIRIAKTYYCPHHPKGKIKKYKKHCSCRKPGTRLLECAQKEFNIDFKGSYFIGDKTSDILAGKRVGCKTIILMTGHKGEDGLFPAVPDFIAKDLIAAIRLINQKDKDV